MKVYEGSRCSFLLFDLGEIWNFTMKKSRNRRSHKSNMQASCKHTTDQISIKTGRKQCSGRSRSFFSSLVLFGIFPSLTCKLNSELTIGHAHFRKLRKALEALRSQYNQSLLTMKYLQLEHGNLFNCLCLLDLKFIAQNGCFMHIKCFLKKIKNYTYIFTTDLISDTRKFCVCFLATKQHKNIQVLKLFISINFVFYSVSCSHRPKTN